jgi:S-formylglutathione hydrolase FrmB
MDLLNRSLRIIKLKQDISQRSISHMRPTVPNCWFSSMKRIIVVLVLITLISCTSAKISPPLAQLPTDCTAPGEIVRGELAQPSRGYTYSYRIYLPPCFSAQANFRYPVLYLIPGLGSGPDAWFASGLAEVADNLILSHEIPPFIIVSTESTGGDPLAETIYNDLIPAVESQYPVMNDRRYRAVAGGSLGGIAAYRLAFQYPDTFASAGIFGMGAVSGEEKQIKSWLSAMNEENRVRVFMDCGDEDVLSLRLAEVMKSLLDAAGIENQLHVGSGGHNYTYWLSNFELYLKWVSQDWK